MIPFRHFLGTLLLILSLQFSVSAQESTVYSKYSDEVNKSIAQLVGELTLEDLKDQLGLTATAPESAQLKKFASEDFSLTLEESQDAFTKRIIAEFEKAVGDISKTDEAKIDQAKKDTEDFLSKEYLQRRSKAFTPISEAKKSLEAENSRNIKAARSVADATYKSDSKFYDELSKKIKSSVTDFVASSNGQPIENIKQKAAEQLTQKSIKEFPDLDLKALAKTAEEKFKYYKVGDSVKVQYAPTPSRVLSLSGPIKALDAQRVKINFTTISIKDIIDPLQRICMSKTETLKKRKVFQDEKVAELKESREKYFNENIQVEVDSLVKQNEANGFVLNIGKWKPASEVFEAALQAHVNKLKLSAAKEFDSAFTASNKRIKDLSDELKGFIDVLNAEKKEISEGLGFAVTKKKQDTKLAAQEMSDEELAKQEALEKKRLKELQEAEDQKLREEQERLQAIKDKQNAIAAQNQQSSDDNTVYYIIGLVVVLIIIFALVAFNKKVHDKILGNKKQSMMDIVNQPVAQQNTPQQASNNSEIEIGPRGSMAPKLKTTPPVGNSEQVDAEIHIDRDQEPKIIARQRKKISLNLKESTTSLDKDLIPPGSGGLTPPGSGGLTPPGSGELKPPGEKIDKSNLILNPNLQADGEKLQLKK